ncbi:MAG: choice-of-anchor B family protein [Cyclobacteriaceae bacterium]
MSKNLLLLILTFVLIHVNLLAQSPCINGLADDLYPCNQMTLLSHMEPSEIGATLHNGFYLNDIWGWSDTTNTREYAIVGLKDGVSFVDITDPINPKYLGKLPEPSSANARIMHGKSTWRDVKVYKDHAFIVSDINGEHGMQVFDLHNLRGLDGSSVQTFRHDYHYTEIGSAHNIVINEETGYAYIVGTTRSGTCRGGLHVVDISSPKQPEYVNCFSEDGYTHDAQCVIYQGPDSRYAGKEVCFNSNENTLTIVNVDDKAAMNVVGRSSYANVNYAHQGWLTEDHRFFLLNDELDEQNGGIKNPRTLIWNVEDLENPTLIGEYYNTESGIDHNLYTHEGLVYESNYLTGLRILDAANVSEGKLRERAFFDTYPTANSIHFGGNWSNYPYFSSGTIIASDMNNGLFLLRLDLVEDPIKSHPQTQSTCSGGLMELYVSVDEPENNAFQWQVLDGTRYRDLVNDHRYAGVNDTLLIAEADQENSTLLFRCKITDEDNNVHYSYLAGFEGIVPVVDFTYELSDSPGTVVFTNQSTDATSYLWEFSDGSSSTDENPTMTFGIETDISVKLSAFAPCGVDRTSKTISFNLLDVHQSHQLTIYPNPTSDRINLNYEQNSTFTLRDISGKVVMEEDLNPGLTTLDLSGFYSGIYLVSVFDHELHKVVHSGQLIIQ